MSILLKQFYSFFKLLNSDTGTNQLAAGLAFGLVFGFSPFLSLQTLLVLVIVFFFRVQLGAALLSAFFFKFIAFLMDPISDSIGRAILESPALRPTFIALYNMPFLPLTRFNNSIVMGSGVISFLLVIPAFFVFKNLVIKYREKILARFKETRFWKALKATGFYKWFETYQKLYG